MTLSHPCGIIVHLDICLGKVQIEGSAQYLPKLDLDSYQKIISSLWTADPINIKKVITLVSGIRCILNHRSSQAQPIRCVFLSLPGCRAAGQHPLAMVMPYQEGGPSLVVLGSSLAGAPQESLTHGSKIDITMQ